MRFLSTLRLVAWYLALFFVQDVVVARIPFPIAGFSLYLLIVMAVALHEEGVRAPLNGFVAGLILDLSPSTHSPLGIWALVLTIASTVVSQVLNDVGDASEHPLTLIAIVVGAVTSSILLFEVINVLTGATHPTLWYTLRVLLGNAVWTVTFAPLVIPLINFLRKGLLVTSDMP